MVCWFLSYDWELSNLDTHMQVHKFQTIKENIMKTLSNIACKHL